MAIIRDMMAAFELFQPASIDETVDLLGRFDDGWVLAGGLDSFEWFKMRHRRPRVVIDVSGVEELKGIRDSDGGLEIGAMTTLTEIVTNETIRQRFGVLSTAAYAVATPQIRNQGTIGGNISQDTRCWYYRGGWPCYRDGGNICYADTPTSMNREHCIFGASRCVAVNPSDTAPALIALDAKIVVRSGGSERVFDAEDFFIGPSTDITRMTVLKPGDLVTAVRIPAEWADSAFYFEKARDRQSWDFPLVNVATAIKTSGGTIQDIRLAVNAVAPYPMRLTRVEDQLRGQPINEDVALAAGEMAIQGAHLLRQNAYKVPLLRNLVKRAIRDAEVQ
ncbi:MAG: xanthine dehydrogenase family protein subunit M [Acidobacteria bacterium]|nr:xanthine dehydrogenase family protein subunit M [Acidobacteriota bacterium]